MNLGPVAPGDYSQMGRYVPAEVGSSYSPGDILFVARDPGEKEVDQGRPLIGSSGSLLTGGFIPGRGDHPGVLSQAGLRRRDVALANLVPVRPWNNNFYKHPWDRIHEGQRELDRVVSTLDPGLIVALGAKTSFALINDWQHLTGQNEGGKSLKSAKKIMERRGYFWHPEDWDLRYDVPVLSTLHPAACLYNPVPHEILLTTDVKRAEMKHRGALPKLPWPEVRRVRTKADMEPLYDSDLVAYDIETTWGGAKFLCIAFYAENLTTASGDPYALVAYDDAIGAVEDWLASDVRKVAHNKQFDNYYLRHKMDLEIGGTCEDTQLAWHAANLELAGKPESGREDTSASRSMTRKSLAFLAAWDEVDLPYWKTAYGTGDAQKMGALCTRDVYATRKVWPYRLEDLKDRGVVDQYELHRSMPQVLNKMQSRGIRIDEDLRQKRVKQLYQRSQRLERKAEKAALDFLQRNDITHKEDGDELWWFHMAQCTCCNGGSKKAEACPSCQDLEPSGESGFLVSDYRTWAEENTELSEDELDELNKEDLRQLLPPCSECGGVGKVPEWDLNIMSQVQLPEILWEHLGVPKYTHKGKGPNAQEETIRRAQEWAHDADYTRSIGLGVVEEDNA